MTKRPRTFTPSSPATSAAHSGPETEEESVLSLIRQLQAGSVTGAALPLTSRRLCVEHLTSEGYTVAEIAQILGVSDRSVKRDRLVIRQSHAVDASPEFTSGTVGMLVLEASTCVGRIRKASRGNDVEPHVKVEAERSIWTITRELVVALQRLGYLPTAPQVFQGQLNHQLDDGPDQQQIESDLARLETVIREADNPRLMEQLGAVRAVVSRIAVSDQLSQLRSAARASESSLEHKE